jgi:tetratricopeptide (TPR) repeat protein
LAKRENPSPKELEALGRAQDLVYDAWDAPTTKRRAALATRAIEISPLCADAWLILAQMAEPGTDREMELLLRAVDVGKAALGSSFDELTGEFWGWLETRPYMRARQVLATTLWGRGLRDDAITHLSDMLRLNPNDNQGLRYMLIGYLAETDRHAEIERLKESYPGEGMAMWLWPLALAAFRRDGDTDASRKALRAALKSNKYVAGFLLGRRKLPKAMPDYYGIGDLNEAVLYAAEFTSGWQSTSGAIEWVGAATSGPSAVRPASRH